MGVIHAAMLWVHPPQNPAELYCFRSAAGSWLDGLVRSTEHQIDEFLILSSTQLSLFVLSISDIHSLPAIIVFRSLVYYILFHRPSSDLVHLCIISQTEQLPFLLYSL